MKYIVVFESCDPFICSNGCYILENEKELKEYCDNLFEDSDRIFIIKKEITLKEFTEGS